MSPEAPTPVRRLWRSMRQFLKFGIVGGSGVIVNLLIVVLVKKIAWWSAQLTADDAFANLFGSMYHVRWYHIFATLGFLVANTWNYQLNRMWTFKGANTRSWLRGFWPFLLTGIGAYIVSLVVMTLLMNQTSPVALPADIFDDTTGLRTRVYWANAIAIVVSMPVNFIINKLWAFRRPKVTIIAETSPAPARKPSA